MFDQLLPLKRKIWEHPLGGMLKTERDLQIFTESHIFAVWDFMNLLKSLQLALTGMKIPWRPTPEPLCRRLINEIVLEEESDAVDGDNYLSHYELYRLAMKELNSDDQWISQLENHLASGQSFENFLNSKMIPSDITQFLQCHWEVVQGGDLIEIAALFALGREDLIPGMFHNLLTRMNPKAKAQAPNFIFYLSRHLEHDEERHRPLSLKLLSILIGEDSDKSQKALSVAKKSLESRLQLWNGIQKRLSG